ncbi:hypothetical protein [Aureimonas sp. ME7]|uniref:rhamnosyltransferase WsaF family glycosyltransferase n=1 Tax=Aureimonas sp. ME7 TaxID=2744252 RepID=UPI0015F5C54D|nr:hypothetical protein [Aureimonas sp. ME7]
MNAFHGELLAHLGSSWDDPMPVSNAFVETPAGEGFVRRLAAIIDGELFAGAPIFAVKDPRMSRFVPLWRAAMKAVGAEPKALLPLRHPLDVAASLGRRDGFPRAKSLLLWLDHTLAAEAETRDMTRAVLSYDDLLADWRGVMDKVGRELDLTWPKERARAEADIDAFLSRDLRHHAERGEIGSGTRLDALTTQAWSALMQLAAGDAPSARAALDAVRDEVAAASSLLSPYVAWEFRALEAKTKEARDLDFHLRARENELAAAVATGRGELRAAQAEHAREHARMRSELALASAENDRLKLFPEQLRDAEFQISSLRQDILQREAALDALTNSTSWRALQPMRRMAQALPPESRAALRALARGGWQLITPWRAGARREVARTRLAMQAGLPMHPVDHSLHASATEGGAAWRPHLGQPPLSVFEAPADRPRVSMVTDSINEGSLFGGVATALIFSALFAQRTGRKLRIVTRTQPPAAENVAALFRAQGIQYDDNIDFAFADIASADAQIDISADELFITTSWWTTRATLQSIAEEKVIYLLQEDERMFYPFGDEALLSAETMGRKRVRKVINSELLHRHLVADGIIDADTPFFEPAFPDRIYFPNRQAKSKKVFFFYARPNNSRNLYARGLEVIEKAIVQGILSPDEWDIVFVGKDLQPLSIAGVRPIIRQGMAWEEYAEFTRSVDLGLTLMYTPHPSYPPLDIAACGGVAVTNTFGVKTDLAQYSRSILCVEGEVDALVEGLRDGVALAADLSKRDQNLSESGLKRDWNDTLTASIEHLAQVDSIVH